MSEVPPMEFRQMATAFLFREDQVLLMKKSYSRLYSSEFWSGLGGHLEQEELNDPKAACIREIYEESGLQNSDIQDLTLKYILLRIKEREVRQQFVYFGRTKQTSIINSDEGELYWIEKANIPNLHMSKIIMFTLEHYFQSTEKEGVMVGVITMNDHNEPHMQWSELKDPNIF
jgi:8-oxo-dGTP diphosphatase